VRGAARGEERAAAVAAELEEVGEGGVGEGPRAGGETAATLGPSGAQEAGGGGHVLMAGGEATCGLW
jgi:hypothetical protein